ncbi:MAG TPA: nucleotidyl transferase AbiEii/AbiGii toxin family protein [Thermoanaerobacter sp.]|nr:nucleotidyl transferase AbiEii/AbiGii toxin family protein [Thermoanaerobacter sp.]
MFERAVHPEALEVLKRLDKLNDFKNLQFYLAGGTGLALQLGHRLSEDLDFFTNQKFDTESMIHKIANIMSVKVTYISEDTVHLLCNSTKVSLFYYPYNLVFPLLTFEGCFVADYRDIAAMKLIALGQRGAKKDFVDLYFYFLKNPDLNSIKKVIEKKYANINYNWLHLLRSMGYFEDAERDSMPVLITGQGYKTMTAKEWENVKSSFVQLQNTGILELQKENLSTKTSKKTHYKKL